MVAIRKAGAYSKKYARPYTRISKKKSKSFIRTVPPSKVVKFSAGTKKNYGEKKFETEIRIVSEQNVQIRDNALEASRQSITRELDRRIPRQYYFEVRVFPHHILRENKMLTGAGADRMQSGMQQSFGKAMGRAALVSSGKDIFLISTSGDKQVRAAREILKSIRAKLPCKTRIVVSKVI